MIALGVVCLVVAAVVSIFLGASWHHPAVRALVVVGAILVGVGVVLALSHHPAY